MTDDHLAGRRQLRQELRARRRGLPAAERIAAADALASHLLTLPFAPQSGYVAGYWAMDGEIALHAWQLRLPPDCVYCLPV
ncbi:MAG TPA: 5-formyltetrahydrofolate cyclo-ligase, partial [Lysobacter sp.]|nr:5-formyltetrahydrofolate cyclo-ligase [Lysobacter sp.]